MSLFTGLTPIVHGVSNVAAGPMQKLDERIPTYVELLAEEGYDTAGFHGGGNVDASFGFARGFDLYSQDYVPYAWIGLHESSAGLSAVRRFVQISRDRGRPLFLFLHHYVCHAPYLTAPEALRDRFLEGRKVAGLPLGMTDAEKAELSRLVDDRTAGKRKRQLHGRIFQSHRESFWSGVDLARDDHREHISALYDANVAYADVIFQRVVDLLRAEGVYDDSIVVLFSDHGEEFHEHGGLEHRQAFIETLHVPLAIKPASRSGITPRVVSRTVRTMDLMPTLLELAGIEDPYTTQAASFGAFLRGNESGYAPEILSYHGHEASIVRLEADGLAYTNQPSKNGRDSWLFSLADDPRERRDLSEARRADVERLSAAAQARRDRDLAFRDDLLRALRRPPQLDPALVEQLRHLGYID